MNAIVATKTDAVIARQFALRFELDMPDEVIDVVTARWNQHLAQRFPGEIYFPEEYEVEKSGTKQVKAVYLHADCEGWSAYMKRGCSIRPMVEADLTAEGIVIPMRVPYLGQTARAIP